MKIFPVEIKGKLKKSRNSNNILIYIPIIDNERGIIDMEKIYDTEIEYLKCFSEHYEDNQIIRFIDRELGDMYSHNLTYIKRDVPDEEVQRIIEQEFIESSKLGKSFLNIQFDFPYRPSMLKNIPRKPIDIATYSYYRFNIESFNKVSGREDCIIQKLDRDIVDQALKLDLDTNGDDMGREFINRRFERRSKIYLQSGMVDSYICFHENEAIGHCDLFLNGNIAKIEDFDVAPNKQRKGYGTTILKEMIKIAMDNGADIIYLITDNSDTAKEMYQKSGFSKIGQKTEMLFL